MRRRICALFAVLAIAVLAISGCGQSAPSPAATQAPAAPANSNQAAQPTAAAAAPTSAPKAVAFPEKGKSITMIVPWDAGGGTDVTARLLAAALEKELGVPVQVVNKPGGGSQVGITELARAKPDGYTIGVTNLPSTLTTYLDPDRQAAFTRKDLQPLGLAVQDPGTVAVKGDSPYKTMADLVEAAKKDKLSAGASGIMSAGHLITLEIEKEAGVSFKMVQFDGGAPARTALMGGHIDLMVGWVSELLPQFKSGELRILGIMDDQESKFMPGVKTMESQGLKIIGGSSRGLSAPAGTPKEVVDALSTAIEKATQDEQFRKKSEDAGVGVRFMDAAEFEAYWADAEARTVPIIEEIRKEK